MDQRLERRKNVNRGYRKLRTWQMAIELYAFLHEKVKEIPDRPYRLTAQILDATSSVSANIAEGYCRRSLKEYLKLSQYRLGIRWRSLLPVLRLLSGGAIFRNNV